MTRPVPRFPLLRSSAGITLMSLLLGGCAAFDPLKLIGDDPPLSAIDNPTAKPGYKPVQMPMPTPQPASYNPNSLWRNGSPACFHHQRSHQGGGVLSVDSENETRTHSDK